MKKTLLLTIALFLSAVAFSQSHVFLSESFDGENFPEGWTLSETGKDNWEISVSNHAGGKPNELFLNNFPPLFNETTRVISPAVNLNGVDEEHGHGRDRRAEDIVPLLAVARVALLFKAVENAVASEKYGLGHRFSPFESLDAVRN